MPEDTLAPMGEDGRLGPQNLAYFAKNLPLEDAQRLQGDLLHPDDRAWMERLLQVRMGEMEKENKVRRA